MGEQAKESDRRVGWDKVVVDQRGRVSLIVAVHGRNEYVYGVGLFSTPEKAMQACEDYHRNIYDDTGPLRWDIEEDEGVFLSSVGFEGKEFEERYYCIAERLDVNSFEGVDG